MNSIGNISLRHIQIQFLTQKNAKKSPKRVGKRILDEIF